MRHQVCVISTRAYVAEVLEVQGTHLHPQWIIQIYLSNAENESESATHS